MDPTPTVMATLTPHNPPSASRTGAPPDDPGSSPAHRGSDPDNLFDALSREKKIKEENLNSAQKNFLKSLTCSQQTPGTWTVFDQTGKKPLMEVDEQSKCVGFDSRGPRDGVENIDNFLKACAVSKAMNGSTQQSMHAASDLELMMMAKAASLAGLNVSNKPDKTLDQVNPALARRMEQEWNTMNSNAGPGAVTPNRASVASGVNGLVGKPSDASPLTPSFNATAGVPAAIPANTTPLPAPSVPRTIPAPGT